MNQAIAFKLANMITEIDAGRLLTWRAAWLGRNGGVKNGEGSMSKDKASEVAVRVTEEAIQILGGLVMDLRDLLQCEVDVVTEQGLRPRVAASVVADAVVL